MLRQQPRERGDHSAVGLVRFRAGDLAAQDCDLMPQYQDLYVPGGIAAGKQRNPAEQPNHEQVAGRMSTTAEDRSPG